jgi:DNA polymerase-1
MIPRQLQLALLRGQYMQADASYRFAPLDVPALRKLQSCWHTIRERLAGRDVLRYDIFDGHHFSYRKFEGLLQERGLEDDWPTTPNSNARRMDEETWEEMWALDPEIERVYRVYATIKMPQLNIACDADGRNRVLLGAFGAITSRNTPSGGERGAYIFSLPKWTRFLIKPPDGWALAYIDWSCQEYGIAAILSGDENMIRSYEAGDPYLRFAMLACAIPPCGTKEMYPTERKVYKQATLAIGYGQGVPAFARKTGVGMATAEQMFADYRRVYSRYCAWRDQQVDTLTLRSRLETRLGWPLHQGPRVKPTTPLNFTAQATGAEMLRLAVMGMMERGVEVCCPVHDALLIQAPAGKIEHAVAEARAAMGEASALLLDGYTLRTDDHRYLDRFEDKDGNDMWEKISAIAAFL